MPFNALNIHTFTRSLNFISHIVHYLHGHARVARSSPSRVSALIMVKPIIILAQCLLLPSLVLGQGQVTVRIPTCDPRLGTTGSISGEPAGATGLAGEGSAAGVGSSGGGSAAGGGNVPGGGSAGGVSGTGSGVGGSASGGGSGGSGSGSGGSGVAPGGTGGGPSS